MVEALPAHLLRCPSSIRSRTSIRSRADAHQIPDSWRAGDTYPTRLKPLVAALATLTCLSLPSLANAACYNPDSTAHLNAQLLDWVPLSDLTPAQRAQQPTACCGAYITPARSDADALADPATSTLRARADSSDARLQSEIIMRGNVQITQGYRAIRADNAIYSQASRQAEISGDIQMREPGLLLRAERATVDIDKGNASLEQAQFVLHETRIRGEAERLEKFGARLFRLEDSRFTSCEPGSKLWSISGSVINIYPEEHYGTARNMRLNIMDVPLVYLPYARFPVGNERLTGFLFPSMGFDRRHGLDDVEIPFYWNIAPNYDMTLIPRYMAEHGGILDVEARHLSTYFETQLDLSYMASDLGNYTTAQEQQIVDGLKTDYSDQERWMLSLEQTGGRSERWSTRIDYTDISDTDYLLDVNGSALDENRQANITQLVAADYRSDNWLVGIQTEEFRLLTERQLTYRELPRVQADGGYRINDWQLTLDHEYIRFDRNTNFTGNLDTLILGERLRTNYQVTWDKDFIWGFFKPGVAYKTLNYQLDNRALVDDVDNAPTIQTPQASLDTGLYFERELQFGDNAFVQTLEPRLFYFHSDYQDHSELYGLTSNNRYINFDTAELTFNYNQLFRDTRFSGGDRLDDANQVTVGLSSAWIEQASGIERLRLSIGQVMYFDDRQVSVQPTATEQDLEQPDTSPIAAQISAQLGSGLRVSSDIVYNHETDKVDGGTANLRFMDENYRILNLGYRYTRNPAVASPINPNPASTQKLDQIDASVIWPVSTQWALIARSNYDFRYDLELDTFAGLEYNDCCYRVRVMARRWLNFNYDASFLATATRDDYREGVFLDIQLKGLGNIGERVSSLLDKAIFGYSDREKNLR
jgi:LPS-assembly protein